MFSAVSVLPKAVLAHLEERFNAARMRVKCSQPYSIVCSAAAATTPDDDDAVAVAVAVAVPYTGTRSPH